MHLTPLKTNIIFQFLDSTAGKKGKFTDKLTASGIIIPTLTSEQKKSRWARVVASGPDSEVQTGDIILIESLMWSDGFEFNGERHWKTDDSKVLMVAESEAATEGVIIQ